MRLTRHLHHLSACGGLGTFGQPRVMYSCDYSSVTTFTCWHPFNNTNPPTARVQQTRCQAHPKQSARIPRSSVHCFLKTCILSSV